MKIISIIPARKGSKRIKNKNIISLGGYPLICWTIFDALSSKFIDNTYISTNCNKVKIISEKYGAEVIIRPDEYCTDGSHTEEAISHLLEQIDFKPDYIALMQCTSPFRDKGAIDSAIEKIINENADSLFFGCPIGRWLWTDANKSINYNYKKRIMTQEKKWELIEGGDYIFKADMFLKTKRRLGGKIIHYDISKLGSIDIDEKYDYRIAKAIVKEFNLNAKD